METLILACLAYLFVGMAWATLFNLTNIAIYYYNWEKDVSNPPTLRKLWQKHRGRMEPPVLFDIALWWIHIFIYLLFGSVELINYISKAVWRAISLMIRPAYVRYIAPVLDAPIPLDMRKRKEKNLDTSRLEDPIQYGWEGELPLLSETDEDLAQR